MAIQLGIIGGGFVAAFHVRASEAVRGLEIAALTSRTPPLGIAEEVTSKRLGDGVVYDSIEEMVENVDVVALFSPNFARIPAMEAIARSVEGGASLKALVCEKPLGRNMAEARRILQLAEQIGVPTSYFENQIHLPSLIAARTQLGAVADAMGPLGLARAAEEHAGPHNAWFWDPTQQGGGVLSDMGCHSIAVGWYMLTPVGKPADYLVPEKVTAQVGLLKWGQPKWRQELKDNFGVDYTKTPAEDFATGTVTFRDPETQKVSLAQFTVSWMYDKQGLRLLIDGLGPGYAMEVNSLRSPLELFIGDAAAAGVADAEVALEKATASQGLLTVQPDEPALYGYVDEQRDLVEAIEDGRPPLLDWSYGLEIVRLTMAAYMSAEQGRTVDLTDPSTLEELETYVPLIQQGRGGEVLDLVD
ncbi:MAG: Gfo/Idh/MocA family oxidoreductase [Acidimicrobiia bacterium]